MRNKTQDKTEDKTQTRHMTNKALTFTYNFKDTNMMLILLILSIQIYMKSL